MKKSLVIALLLITQVVSAQMSVKIKDISRIAGVRDNQLIGYGLVVGLNGRGDSSKSKITKDTAANMFQKFGIRVDPQDIISRNIAAVIVTASLPSFTENGMRIDIKVSSVGDATSIENGELLQTALQAADGQTYAVAQGTVVTIYKERSDFMGRITSGYIPSGALIERVHRTSYLRNNTLSLVIDQADFTTLKNAVEAINRQFGSAIASSQLGGTVDISVPVNYQQSIPQFISEIGNLEIEPGNIARVVIDRRSGTVVMGGDIKISAVAISQKSLSLEIGQGRYPYLDELNEKARPKSSYVLEESTDVQTIVDGLNRMGAKTEDIISIMRALKAAGALYAELIIL
jgi:flagellar P-ring protein precursor FlgI